MQLTTSMYNGVELLVPANNFMWPRTQPFPSCCGAGEGIQEKLIPDTFYGLSVSPACWIHDQMFVIAGRSWEEFYQCNDTFLHNLKQIVKYKSGNRLMTQLRLIRAYEYYAAVNLPGSIVFWKLKDMQGLL